MYPPPRVKKAAIHVLGCKVNQAEAAALGKLLEAHGYVLDSDTESPDLVLVNTCCVTGKAEGKSRRFVARLAERFPGARLVVTGCLAEVNPESLSRIAGGPMVLGTYAKDHFADYLAGEVEPSNGTRPLKAHSCTGFSVGAATGIPGRSRAFLKVQDGCSQYCSYCIVPRARGPARSLSRDVALDQARAIAAEGFPEIVLTGVHLGSWGRDLTSSGRLEDLLDALLSALPHVRFRLSSIEPQEITPRLIALAASEPGVCRHFHIPLQSGDDGILRRMRRPYTAQEIKDLLGSIFEASPEACVGLDVMVGFPGEDDESFQRTAALLEGSGAAYLHVFPFSPRPGTPAASFKPRVPDRIARERVVELRLLSARMRQRFYGRFVGCTLEAVAESEPDADGLIIARTDNYIPVRARIAVPELVGSRFAVRIEKVKGEEAFGVNDCVTSDPSPARWR